MNKGWLDFFEQYVFMGKREGRAVLYTCKTGESAQVYAESISDVFDILFNGVAGFCDVRRSINPRRGDINTVPYIEHVGVDIDVEGDLEAAKIEAIKLAEVIERLDGRPLVVFTGGKGYSVVVPVENPLEPDDSLYRAIMSDLVAMSRILHADMNPGIKYLVRVPFTRHTKTDRMCLIYDYKNDKHVDYIDEALRLMGSVKPIRVGNYEKQQKIRIQKQTATRTKRIHWIEEVENKCISDCRHRFVLAVLARYLVNVLKMKEEDAVERILAFAERCGAKMYKSWIRSVVRGVANKKLMPYSCDKFFSEEGTYSCKELASLKDVFCANQ